MKLLKKGLENLNFQKKLGLLIVIMLLISISPLALADEQVNDIENVDDGSGEVKNAEKKVQEKNRDRKLGNRESRERAKARIRTAKAKLDDAHDQYKVVKTRFSEARMKFDEHKDTLTGLRDNAKRCSDEEDCKTKKTGLKKGVQNHLVKTGELIERTLEKLTNRVENSKELTDEQKEDALIKINSLEEELAAEQAEVEALENPTNEELRKSIQALKKTWQEVRKMQKGIVTDLIGSKMDDLNEKNVRILNGMQSRIDKLTSLDIDVSSLEELMENFKVADEKLNADKETWKSDKTKENLNVVKEDLKVSKEILREFVNKFNELKPADTTE
jgi:chromosome segregation ATPase